jgi:hypothetical protein
VFSCPAAYSLVVRHLSALGSQRQVRDRQRDKDRQRGTCEAALSPLGVRPLRFERIALLVCRCILAPSRSICRCILVSSKTTDHGERAAGVPPIARLPPIAVPVVVHTHTHTHTHTHERSFISGVIFGRVRHTDQMRVRKSSSGSSKIHGQHKLLVMTAPALAWHSSVVQRHRLRRPILRKQHLRRLTSSKLRTRLWNGTGPVGEKSIGNLWW